MNSSPEEFRIPILENLSSPPRKVEVVRSERRFFPASSGESCQEYAVMHMVFVVFMILVIAIPNLLFEDYFTTYMPQFRLDSLVLCHTNTPNNNNNNELVIWDLRFDIKNPNNHSRVCIDPLEVSIFIQNQTKFLTRTAVGELCVGPRNHTSTPALADAFLLHDDPNDLDWMNNKTIRFDLKINGGFYFTYSLDRGFFHGDLVCGDAKVALPTSSNSSCRLMVGDPVGCSYK